MTVVIENFHIDSIPVLEITQKDAPAHLPLVILIHGWTGRKEDVLFFAYFLAVRGYFVVSMDAFGHGERARKEDWTIEAFYDLLLQTSEDINRVIAHYSNDIRVDVNRVGLSGVSIGGVITYYYLTREDNRISAAVPMIATPDFSSLINFQNSKEIMQMLGLEEKDFSGDTTLGMMMAMQPAVKMELMTSVPLLMLNGTSDPLIDLEGVRQFYQNIKPLYNDPEAVQLIEFQGVTHYTPYEMQIAALEWFQKYV